MEFICRIRLLGTIQIEKNDAPVRGFESRKALALLGYLASQAQPVSRSQLAGLFWGDKTEARGRRNLSRELSQLSSQLPNCFQADYHTVQFQPVAGYWVDTYAFAELIKRGGIRSVSTIPPEKSLSDSLTGLTEPAGSELQPGQLAEAVALYRGDFMAGYYLDDCPEFETWLLREQEVWRRQVTEVLDKLIGHYASRSQDDQAEFYARRWLALEPWRERAHRYLMLLLARNGNRSAALAQYETCRQALADELAVEPSAETVALYEQIRRGEFRRKVEEAGGQAGVILPPQSASPSHDAPPLELRIPIPSTAFINREKELAQLAEYLSDPACRLITVVGPGGIGKTRLAIQATLQAAARLADRDIAGSANQAGFTHGIYFIPLAPLSSAQFLISAIADALKFSFYSGADPVRQLLNYLREKQLLLVLDNFDHLLAGADLLADILAYAPQVKILAVSRERLNLHEEYLLPVQGMNIPANENGKDGKSPVMLESYSAIQLFLQQAQLVYPDFTLSAEDKPSVARICQLVEGIPLAIELAAAWVRMLSCREIAQEIEQNLDFLATSLRNIPERHRSMRAVFEYSWQLLSDEEKRVFRQLAVFRGGFQREAAEQVVGASLPLLLALVDKSLVRRLETGRFERHILLWQYAAEKLDELPAEKERILNRHCDYYATFLQQRKSRLEGGDQKATLAEISTELENVRASWRRAIEQGKTAAIEQALESLFHFYDMRSWFQEGAEAFGRAAESLKQSLNSAAKERPDEGANDAGENLDVETILGKLLARQGWFTFQLGRHGRATTLLEESLALLRRVDAAHDTRRELIFTLNYLGAVYRHLGEYEPAKQYLQESLAICREVGDRFGLSIALNILGQVAYLQGDYPVARQLCRESLAIKQEIGDRRGMAFSLTNLGRVAQALAEYSEAKQLFQESLAICREIDERRSIGLNLNHLGDVARTLKDYREARQLYGESLAIFKQIGNQWGVVFSLTNLGDVACALEDYPSAKIYLNDALKKAMDIEAAPLVLDVLLGVATLLTTTGEPKRALEILALLLTHPASSRETQDKAALLLAELEARLPTETVSTIQESAGVKTLGLVVQEILQD